MYKLVWILLFSLVMLLLIFDQFGGISVSLVDNMTLKLIKYFFQNTEKLILWMILSYDNLYANFHVDTLFTSKDTQYKKLCDEAVKA